MVLYRKRGLLEILRLKLEYKVVWFICLISFKSKFSMRTIQELLNWKMDLFKMKFRNFVNESYLWREKIRKMIIKALGFPFKPKFVDI